MPEVNKLEAKYACIVCNYCRWNTCTGSEHSVRGTGNSKGDSLLKCQHLRDSHKDKPLPAHCSGAGESDKDGEGPGTGARKVIEKGFAPLEDWLRNKIPTSDPAKYYSPADAAAQTGGILKSRGEGAQPNLPSSVPAALKPINMRSPRQAAPRPEIKEPEKLDYTPDAQLRATYAQRKSLPPEARAQLDGRRPAGGGGFARPGARRNERHNAGSGARQTNGFKAPVNQNNERQSGDQKSALPDTTPHSDGSEQEIEQDDDSGAWQPAPELEEDIDLDGRKEELCPIAAKLEDSGKILLALGYYRNCLFDPGTREERLEADAGTLYRLITRAWGWLEPPMQPPSLAVEALKKAESDDSEAGKLEHEALFYAPWWDSAHYALASRLEKSGDFEHAAVHYVAFLKTAAPKDPRFDEAQKALDTFNSKEKKDDDQDKY